MSAEEAVKSLKAGKPVVIFDGEEREGEADFFVHASFVDAKAVERLRKEGGGLVCLATSNEAAEKIGLPFLTDLFAQSNGLLKQINYSKTPYGDKPAFSISINHKTTFTGISDRDRSTTIREFEKIVSKSLNNGARDAFASSFRAPGHVHLLIARSLRERKGHTELALELARRAGLSPAMVLCEILGSGKALNKKQAKVYAEKNHLEFLEAKEILDSS